MIAGTIRLSTMPPPLTAAQPPAATTDPTRPPISACEELDGSPKYQVITFQAIAPTSPLNTTVVVTALVSTKPLAIVVATFSEMNAPTKFSSEANTTACLGPIARVEIDVATTLAVSWNPLVKSNARAVPTTMTRRMSPLISTSLGVLDHDAFEDESDALGGVDRILEQLEDVLPANHDHGVDPVLEQR